MDKKRYYTGNNIKVGDVNYKVVKRMGEGAMGSTYLVNGPDSKLYIIKITSRTEHDYEFIVLEQLRGKCRRYFQCIVDKEVKSDLLMIVIEYNEGFTDLREFLTENDVLNKLHVKKLIADLKNGLKELHSYGIVHRDIKPDNILVNILKKSVDDLNSSIKYIDFGISCVENGEYSSDCLDLVVGTPTYMSPEVIDAQLFNKGLSFSDWKKADIWSLGITIYTIIMGQNPYFKFYPIPDDPIAYNRFLSRIREFTDFEKFDFKNLRNGWTKDEVIEEIGSLLREDPNKREL
jgi:serine/threonine protein kinase